MDFPGTKAPPRYVPTLTEVVTEADADGAPTELPAQEFVRQEPPVAQAAPASKPLPLHDSPAAPVAAPARATAAVLDDHAAAQAEERLVQRLLERVEHGLEERLRDTIAQVVHEQTRSVTLRLQEALESVVRQTVHDALAQEREERHPGR